MPEPHDDQFKHELRELLNRHSMENGSDTPDFILANYLCDCLEAWNLSVTQRSGWYKRSAELTPDKHGGS